MFGRNLPERPADVFESPYYTATLVFPEGDEHELAGRIARKMRVQNSSRFNYVDRNRLAPLSFTHTDDGYVLEMAGKASTDLFVRYAPGENYPSGSNPTKYTIEKFLSKLFGATAEARELPIDVDDDELSVIADSFLERMNSNGFVGYPRESDVLMAGSLDSEGISEASSFVGTSPYFAFTATSKRPASEFTYSPEAYHGAVRTIARNANDRLAVESVFENEEGKIVVRGYGLHVDRGIHMGPAPASETCADAIEYYLDSDIELQLFETTVAAPDDLVAVDRIADFCACNTNQQDIDFRLVSPEAADEAHRKTYECLDLAVTSADKTSGQLFDELIGLDDIKTKARRYVRHLAVRARKDSRMPSPHLLMMGNPGTGKTTMARAIAQALYEEGLIASPSNFVEASRSDLVAGYLGQTAMKTMEAINRARHGVLFIDEAYALSNGPRDSYGAEAIATLVKEMEDCLNDYERRGFVCIMAGYTEPMEEMLGVNPGLRDRFAHRIDFRDYDADELVSIFYKDVDDLGLSIAPDARPMAERLVCDVYDGRDANFANARIIRKLVEHIEMVQLDFHGDDRVVDCDVIEALCEDSEVQLLMSGGKLASAPQALAFM
jgi:AAA+ superfamily predicted ATPase